MRLSGDFGGRAVSKWRKQRNAAVIKKGVNKQRKEEAWEEQGGW